MLQSPDVLVRETEVYCDMILTGQKPVALVPNSDLLVAEVAKRKELVAFTFGTHGTYIMRPEGASVYMSLIQLTQAILDDEEAGKEGTEAYHWIRGHLFGYSEAEILAHIGRCGP